MFGFYIVVTIFFLIVSGVMLAEYAADHDPTTKDILQGLGVIFGWPLLFPIWIGMGVVFQIIATYKYLAKNL